MLRLMMIQLLQWFKSLATSAVDDEAGSRQFSREDGDSGRWTFMTIFAVLTLSLYIVAGLGFFAKVHVWDDMTAQQKVAIAQAMASSSQNF